MDHPHYPHLFRPIRIGPVEVPNRVCHVPTDISSANADGSVNQRVITYHEEIAKGGCGLIIVGASTPDRAAGRPTVTCVAVDEDPLIPGLSELAEAMHRHGARCAVQIQLPGRQAAWPRKGLVSASDHVLDVPGSAGHEVIYAEDVAKGKSIRAMTPEEVYDAIEKFAEGAWRVQQAGFDCVELHAAHGYLIAQFMSPFVNKRHDRFGGSFLGRMRFVLEIIARIRYKCGRDFPIGIRYSGVEWVHGGRELDETVAAAKLFEEHGAAFVDISAGIFEAPGAVMDPMYYPQGWNTYAAEEVKRHVKIPVVTSHTLRDPGYCERILAEGKADLVGLSRQMVADPYWTHKAFRGRAKEIRKCISCLVGCWQESLMIRRHMRCAINPAIGDERFLHLPRARKPLRVAIVGGGPGGMETARIAALRGHQPTVFERTGELGGAILCCCTAPGKNKMRWYADWLREQMKRLGVEVRFRTSPGVEELRGYDAVVVATGGRVARPDVPGVDSPRVVPFTDVLRCRMEACEYFDREKPPAVECGPTVLVWGDHFAAADSAERLAAEDCKVYVVTPRRAFAEWMEPCHRDVMQKRFAGGNGEGLKGKPFAQPVTAIASSTVAEIGGDGEVTLLDGEFRKSALRVDHVVLAAVEPEDGLYAELLAAGVPAVRIGDARGVRNLRAAVTEGANAGLTFDEGLQLNANRAAVSLLPTEVDAAVGQ